MPPIAFYTRRYAGLRGKFKGRGASDPGVKMAAEKLTTSALALEEFELEPSEELYEAAVRFLTGAS